jgi:very-short-patch-repair endonuclease
MARAYVTQLARENRQKQTPAETILWAALRRKAFDGVKFKRQKPIGRYIADFCAPSIRLIIELDGSVHDTPEAQAYDAIREEFLRAAGYTILRFPNQAILENLESTLAKIAKYLP